MRKRLLLFVFPILCLSIVSFKYADTSINLSALIFDDTLSFYVPDGWPAPHYDFDKNPLTTNGIKLGRALFYDDLLSGDTSVSCASCHLSYTNFTHIDHKLSHGIKDRIGNRNTLSIMNTAWQTNFMWDGGVTSLDVQPLSPLTSPHEMDMQLDELIPRLKDSEKYTEMFKEAFGAETKPSGYFMFRAMSQFMLTFNTYNSKYDRVMRKDSGVSFTEREVNGLTIFRKNCESCHQEPLFTNQSYQNNGLSLDTLLNDFGRMKITNDPNDSLKFRVPSLRNIEVSYPYMHDGRFKNLQTILFHYSNGVVDSKTTAEELKGGISLTEDEKRNLVIFLKTLTDEGFLRNKDLAYPRDY